VPKILIRNWSSTTNQVGSAQAFRPRQMIGLHERRSSKRPPLLPHRQAVVWWWPRPGCGAPASPPCSGWCGGQGAAGAERRSSLDSNLGWFVSGGAGACQDQGAWCLVPPPRARRGRLHDGLRDRQRLPGARGPEGARWWLTSEFFLWLLWMPMHCEYVCMHV